MLAAVVARWAGGARLILTRHVLFPLGKANKILLRPVAAVLGSPRPLRMACEGIG